jgi:hypothetical protein
MRQESTAVSADRLQRLLARAGFVRLFVTLASVVTTVGVAEESPPPPNSTETHVQNYGDLETACLRWTDQCRTCSRSGSGDPVCSNIGISCQPAPAVQCLERKQGESDSPDKTK